MPIDGDVRGVRLQRAGDEGVLLGHRDVVLATGPDEPGEDRSSRPDPGRRGRALRVSAHHSEPGTNPRLLSGDDAAVAAAVGARLWTPVHGFHRRGRGIVGDASGDREPRAGRSGPRGSGRDRADALPRRLRRGAEFGPLVAQYGAPRGCGQQDLGSGRRAGGDRLPRHPTQSGDPVGGRWQRARHSSRGRIPVPHVHRTG